MSVQVCSALSKPTLIGEAATNVRAGLEQTKSITRERHVRASEAGQRRAKSGRGMPG